MKKIYWILGALAVAGGGFYIWYKTKHAASAPARATVQTTGTANGTAAWFNSTAWSNQIAQTNALVAAAKNDFSATSNAFGFNPGGAGGVAVSGSNTGGTQSSGSGAGLPVASPDDSADVFNAGTEFDS